MKNGSETRGSVRVLGDGKQTLVGGDGHQLVSAHGGRPELLAKAKIKLARLCEKSAKIHREISNLKEAMKIIGGAN